MSEDKLVVKVDKEQQAADLAYSVQHLRSMVKQLEEIDDDIKVLRDKKKRLFEDYVDEHNIPKKEVREAIKMLRSDIDPSVTTEIYKEIADLIAI
jgi:hypothetical protein